ncbi:MAG: carboxypeptidase-like regulatory domain-containing protein, partial [Acidobacteriota bacterium]|nr:carboxypeptidase-like regulatory domain-containing protein [Acidobacteriota bacterium]
PADGPLDESTYPQIPLRTLFTKGLHFTLFPQLPFLGSRIRITVSDRAGQITGTVLGHVSKPVPGAPIFLWPVAESARRSLSGPLQVLSDTDGRFRFGSLPPGDYRLLASFDGTKSTRSYWR